jgi:IS4 transposase
MVYTVVASSVSLKRQVRAVALVWPGSRRTEVLFSTSTEMTAATIIALYRARFSMEFPFRDGKQFAGLSECQSRQVEALHFHWNMAMTAVSAARLSQLQDQRACPLVFNMEDEKRRAYNAFFAERILSILTVEQTEEKCEELLADLLSLGVKAA